jgi:hypothetical protein
LAIDHLFGTLDYIIDGASDHIQARNDFVRERMVVATLCPFLFKCEPTACGSSCRRLMRVISRRSRWADIDANQ